MISLLLLTGMFAGATVAPSVGSRDSVDLPAIAELIDRVLPGRAQGFLLEVIPDSAGLDVFEIDQASGQVVLRGSSGVALASALNWYLEQVAGVAVSLPLQPISLHSLPAVPGRVRQTTRYRIRYFFNYCTFSYSMAWWDWTDWQRMIDWMALKGVNAPLAVTGQEAVWRQVLQEFGFSREQVGQFLVGPAYLPWGWMGNIDGLGGPLPDSWIDSHITLERQILARERALGMSPVLQGFTGHVPESITQIHPAARIHQTGDWSAGFSGTWFLDPTDSLFQRFGRRFVEVQTELYGTDHLYAADPFNEIDPPSDDSTFLAGMGNAIYGAMAASGSRGDVGAAGLVPLLPGEVLARSAGAGDDGRRAERPHGGPRPLGRPLPGVEGPGRVLRQAVGLERPVQLRRQGQHERGPAENRRQPRQRASQPREGGPDRPRHDHGRARHQPDRARLRDGPGLARQRAGAGASGPRTTSRGATARRTRTHGTPGSCSLPRRIARAPRPATSSPSGRNSTRRAPGTGRSRSPRTTRGSWPMRSTHCSPRRRPSARTTRIATMW